VIEAQLAETSLTGERVATFQSRNQSYWRGVGYLSETMLSNAIALDDNTRIFVFTHDNAKLTKP